MLILKKESYCAQSKPEFQGRLEIERKRQENIKGVFILREGSLGPAFWDFFF